MVSMEQGVAVSEAENICSEHRHPSASYVRMKTWARRNSFWGVLRTPLSLAEYFAPFYHLQHKQQKDATEPHFPALLGASTTGL